MAYDTLQELFTGICDSIRTKEGSTGLINHQDIPTRIVSLASGGSDSNFAYGEFTVATNKRIVWNEYSKDFHSISHGLSVIPNFAIVHIDEAVTPTWSGTDFVSAMKMPWRKNLQFTRTYNATGATNTDTALMTTALYLIQTDATNIKFGVSSGVNLLAGIKYYWVAGYVPYS